MKSIVIYLALLLSNPDAGNHISEREHVNRSALKHLVWKQIQTQLSFPELLIGQMTESKVEIKIALRKDHEIEVLEVKSDQVFTELQIRKALSELKVLVPHEGESPIFTFTLSFDLP